jgi:periodic tryptophan protein 2
VSVHIASGILHGTNRLFYSLVFFPSQLSSMNLGAGGPINDHEDLGDETTFNAVQLPAAKRGDGGTRTSKIEVLTMRVAFSPTGRERATVSGGGLHVYSLDEHMIFDPSLTEAITPSAVESKLSSGDYGMVL